MAKNKALPGNTIVATQMSNIGLDLAMKNHGIAVVRTDVGDKNVVETMRQQGFTLGGEQSGHIIHLDHCTTGDGCVAALNVLAVMQNENKPLADLQKIMDDVPQVLINTRVSRRVELESIKGYKGIVAEVEGKLNGQGRLFVRFSGTEPVVRVLVEGKDKRLIGDLADQVARFLQAELS